MADQWASISDMQTRYDVRTLAQLVSDDDTAGTLAGNAILNAMLEDATGFIQSAIYQGQSYTTTQMATIISDGSPLLKRLVCDIAIKHLFARRARDMPGVVQSQYDDAMDMVDELRKGTRVFDAVQNADAQLPEAYAVPVRLRPSNLPISSSALYPAGRLAE